MESIEVSAKSEEEAVALALSKLGLDRSQVEVEVIKKGRSGLFGLGSEEVRVRVTPLEAAEPAAPAPESLTQASKAEVTPIAREVLQNLLSLMGVPATVNVKTPESAAISGDAEAVSLDVVGEDLGILIGRRGETLATLQYLVNLIVSRKLKGRVTISVDVEGYRERRYEALRALARRLADRVKATGKSMSLEPMPPNERRIVHLELKDDPDVTTESVGQDEERKVAIVPRKTPGSGNA